MQTCQFLRYAPWDLLQRVHESSEHLLEDGASNSPGYGDSEGQAQRMDVQTLRHVGRGEERGARQTGKGVLKQELSHKTVVGGGRTRGG
jgi:hypothetical protein